MTWPIIFMLVGQTLDGVSTGIKLHQGCVEANPVTKHFLKGPVSVAVWKGSVGVTLAFTIPGWGKDHPKLAKTAAYTVGAAGFGAAAWNFSQDCR